ncbi:MAG: hypothetical protein U0892_07110 [Pirellulales bacterium]
MRLNSSSTSNSDLVDVNADGNCSPIDWLTVINKINSATGSTTATSSSVSTDARIARIESDLANGTLPPNITVAEAEQLLVTLQTGGSPELGDCPKPGTTPTNDDLLTDLSERLTDLGVSQETIDAVVAEIQSGLDAGETDLPSLVSTALTDNGVDVKALVDAKRAQEQIAKLTQRLVDAGVDQTVIDTISTEMQAAVTAGTPMTREDVLARLTELGVDVSSIFGTDKPTHGEKPTHDDQPPPGPPPTSSSGNDGKTDPGDIAVTADEVRTKLEKFGVDSTIIDTVISEITALDEAGTPMTRSQLIARLKELGVSLTPPPGPGPGGSMMRAAVRFARR